MKKSTSYLLSSLAVISALSARASDPQVGSGEVDGYKIVWQDLFDGDSLDLQNWNIEVNGNGGGNNELQFYTDEPTNVHVGDDGDGNSCLILTARREYYKGRGVTSGRVNSQKKVNFTHGKIEAAIKLPKTANGLWPAFWMMGDDYAEVGWPRCGETDIMEMGNSTGINSGCQERYFNGACHWGQGWPNASYAKALNSRYSLQDGEYHLFTLIWNETGYKMYLDLDRDPKTNPYYAMDCPMTEPDNEWSPGNYFHKPNFILFNLACGGDFTGIHSVADITALNEENGYEQSMYINYVKIYQKGEDNETLSYVSYPTAGIESIESVKDNGGIQLGSTSVSAPAPLTLWNLDGVKVAHSEAGEIALDGLHSGIYIARSGDASRKISVK